MGAYKDLSPFGQGLISIPIIPPSTSHLPAPTSHLSPPTSHLPPPTSHIPPSTAEKRRSWKRGNCARSVFSAAARLAARQGREKKKRKGKGYYIGCEETRVHNDKFDPSALAERSEAETVTNIYFPRTLAPWDGEARVEPPKSKTPRLRPPNEMRASTTKTISKARCSIVS